MKAVWPQGLLCWTAHTWSQREDLSVCQVSSSKQVQHRFQLLMHHGLPSAEMLGR